MIQQIPSGFALQPARHPLVFPSFSSYILLCNYVFSNAHYNPKNNIVLYKINSHLWTTLNTA